MSVVAPKALNDYFCGDEGRPELPEFVGEEVGAQLRIDHIGYLRHETMALHRLDYGRFCYLHGLN